MTAAAPARSPGAALMLAAVGLYLVLPMLAVLLYSLATRWAATPLPEGYTLAHWTEAFADPRLTGAVLRSLALAAAAVALDVAVVVPAAYVGHVRNHRVRMLAELSAVIPFALPWVSIAFGVLLLAGTAAPLLLGTPLLLVLVHAAVHFPFLYWAVDAAMTANGVAQLNEAAETCGAGTGQILLRVVLPAVSGGIASGGILVFASSFGEFALAQMLVGGSFETVPLWSADALGATVGRFPELAVMTVATFLLLFALSVLLVVASGAQGVRLLPGAPVAARAGGRP